ncbi:MAG: hypothetical protein ACREEM_00535 [Blastocatellia bacterium]
MSAINPEFRELEHQLTELRERVIKNEGESARAARVEELFGRLGHLEGKVEQVYRTASDATRQTIWQFVIFTVTMAGVLIGATMYQTESLRRESNARLEAIEKRIDQSEKNINARIDDMKLRFEDLKQVVLSERKQPAPSQSKNQ